MSWLAPRIIFCLLLALHSCKGKRFFGNLLLQYSTHAGVRPLWAVALSPWMLLLRPVSWERGWICLVMRLALEGRRSLLVRALTFFNPVCYWGLGGHCIV